MVKWIKKNHPQVQVRSFGLALEVAKSQDHLQNDRRMVYAFMIMFSWTVIFEMSKFRFSGGGRQCCHEEASQAFDRMWRGRSASGSHGIKSLATAWHGTWRMCSVIFYRWLGTLFL